MKILRLLDGTEKYLQDDEAENVKKYIREGDKVIELRDGTFFRESIFGYITDVPKIAKWGGFRVYQAMDKRKYFLRDGQKVYLEDQHEKEITYEQQTIPELGISGEAKLLQEGIQ